MYLTYQDTDGKEYGFYCNQITSNRQVTMLIGQPVKDGGSKFITDSDLDFEIDGTIIQGENTLRITSIPEITPKQDNNSRRGIYRRERVIITS